MATSLVALALAGCAGLGTGSVGVTPVRTTASSDTGTLPAGAVDLELGMEVDPGDGRGLPVSVNIGLDPRTELFLGGSLYQQVELDGPDGEGVGDAEVGLRHRFWESDDGVSAAGQLVTTLPTSDADQGLGSGSIDFSASAMVSAEVDEATLVTGFWQVDLLGKPEEPGVDVGHVLAVAAARDLSPRVGVFGELSGALGPDDEDSLELIVGLTRPLVPSVAVDVGCAVPLGGDGGSGARLLVGLTFGLRRPGG